MSLGAKQANCQECMQGLPMQALTMPMMVPLSAGKLRVQVARALVSQKVPAKGATMAIITTCQ